MHTCSLKLRTIISVSTNGTELLAAFVYVKVLIL